MAVAQAAQRNGADQVAGHRGQIHARRGGFRRVPPPPESGAAVGGKGQLPHRAEHDQPEGRRSGVGSHGHAHQHGGGGKKADEAALNGVPHLGQRRRAAEQPFIDEHAGQDQPDSHAQSHQAFTRHGGQGPVRRGETPGRPHADDAQHHAEIRGRDGEIPVQRRESPFRHIRLHVS